MGISDAYMGRLECLAADAGFEPAYDRYATSNDELWSKALGPVTNATSIDEQTWAFLQFGTQSFLEEMIEILCCDPHDLPLLMVTMMQKPYLDGFELGKIELVKHRLQAVA